MGFGGDVVFKNVFVDIGVDVDVVVGYFDN